MISRGPDQRPRWSDEKYPEIRDEFASRYARLAALSVAGTNHALVIVLLLIWGAAYTALPVLMQTWVLKAAARLNGPEAPSSLYVSAYNGAIAAGALIGGVIVDHSGPWSVMPISALMGIPALLIALKHAPE